jgi:hypothetical protein
LLNGAPAQVRFLKHATGSSCGAKLENRESARFPRLSQEYRAALFVRREKLDNELSYPGLRQQLLNHPKGSMKILDKLQRQFGHYAVPNLTLVLIACQVLAYGLQFTQPQILRAMELVPALVLEGEVWRVVSFLFEPPLTNAVFAFFFWYMFYLMGTALERTWGAFRYNVYLLIGYLATVAVSFLTPLQPTSALFLQGSVFLAFAYLYPDFQLMLFFLLPVKVKWLALLTWIGYFYVIATGPWVLCLMALAAICNFLVFFGREIFFRVRAGRRRMVQQTEGIKDRGKAFHRCRICGVTDQSHPDMDFRYCSKCAGGCCYCPEHLRNHEHVTAEETEAVR